MRKQVLFIGFVLLVFGGYGQTFADLVAKVDSSVVTIYVTETQSQGVGDPLLKTSAEGLGSGTLVGTGNQYILTADHVVHAAKEIIVEFVDGRRVGAKVMRSSKMADVALLKLNQPIQGINPAVIGNSDEMRIGDDVFIIGAPLGLTHSVSKGIISGKRSEKMLTSDLHMMEFFQTDASVNQGNSGGPMFNSEGEVIGIVSSILSFSGGFEGLGFAASSNIAKDILTQKGSVWFGIDALPLDYDMCRIFNVPQEGALLVQSIAEKSSAYYMGLKGGYLAMKVGETEFLTGGDIILAFDDITLDGIEKIEQLRAYLNGLEKYHQYNIKVLRAGEIKNLKWQLPE